MEGPGAFLVILGVIAFGALSIYLGWQKAARRKQAWATTAASLGFQIAPHDPFDLIGLPFSLFNKGDGQGVDTVAWGAWEGLDCKAFDAWYYVVRHDTNTKTTRRDYERFTCVLIGLPIRAPHLVIDRENLLSRIADAIGMRDIEFESEEFNRAFQVSADDKRFASYVIDARMMEWLLTTDRTLRFEVSGTHLLCYVSQTDPARVPELLGWAKGFAERVPRAALDVYGGGA